MPLYGIVALALLMVVHESGHFFVAKAFGLRVDRFSIGFGPPIWKHQPAGSPTTYQIGLIPFFAFVQIAGMNPFEEQDETDSGSYANASVTARIASIAAGPIANYLFAALVFFAALMVGGKTVDTTRIEVMPGGAAQAAGLQNGDRVLSIDSREIRTWEGLRKTVSDQPEKPLTLLVDRKGQKVPVKVTPRRSAKGGGLIGVRPEPVPMPATEAAKAAVVQPVVITAVTLKTLFRFVLGKESAQLTGPLGLMRETEKAAEQGLAFYLSIVAFLSTSVAIFNLLPFPALDGGRLLFLSYEAVTRRQPNQKFEAKVHALGMLMLLAAMVLVTVREFQSGKAPSDEPVPASQPKKSAP